MWENSKREISLYFGVIPVYDLFSSRRAKVVRVIPASRLEYAQVENGISRQIRRLRIFAFCQGFIADHERAPTAEDVAAALKDDSELIRRDMAELDGADGLEIPIHPCGANMPRKSRVAETGPPVPVDAMIALSIPRR